MTCGVPAGQWLETATTEMLEGAVRDMGEEPHWRRVVRALVEAWRKHDPRDQGIAILAQSSTVTGATFASGRLELYVK